MGHARGTPAIIGCALSVFLCAGTWKLNGKAVPDSAWAKSDGDFGAELVFTDKPEELFAAWEKPGPAVLISEVGKAMRGKPIVGVIFFAGCAKNEQGNCDATVTFLILAPDGKHYGKPQSGELWTGKPPPEEGQMQLSVGNIGVVIEPNDALGSYTGVAEIRDNVSKKKMVLERKFEAIEASKKD